MVLNPVSTSRSIVLCEVDYFDRMVERLDPGKNEVLVEGRSPCTYSVGSHCSRSRCKRTRVTLTGPLHASRVS